MALGAPWSATRSPRETVALGLSRCAADWHGCESYREQQRSDTEPNSDGRLLSVRRASAESLEG